MKISPVADTYTTIARSSKPAERALSTPSVLALSSGRILASYDEYALERRDPDGAATLATIAASDDGGKTWNVKHRFHAMHGRLFAAGASIYYIGHIGDIVIARSNDLGDTWSATYQLTNRQRWHQSATNVWYRGDSVYLVMERRTAHVGDTWFVPWLSPVLMRGRTADNLLERANWTAAGELPFCDIMPGYKQNQLPIDYFGIPFFSQQYPLRARVSNDRFMHPVGWLEANVVQIMDERHYWYDSEGKTFHLFLRANTGGTGYAAMAKVVEHLDGSMTTTLETTPSGKRILFVPFPGGHLRFHVAYDEETKLYWLLSTQATDSMSRAESLTADRNNLPNNERNRLILSFSKNMIDWCFAALVTMTERPKHTRNYASFCIAGDDLLVGSRSGDEEAASARDTNLITFHRVADFRRFVY